MIDWAVRHLDELNDRYMDVWDNPKYQYYFAQKSRYRLDPRDVTDVSEVCLIRSYVSIDPKDVSVIGHIEYTIDTSVGLAHKICIINFTEDVKKRRIFSIDMYRVLRDIFEKHNCNCIEFCVWIGNPIEESYDKICEHMGGHVVGIKHARGLAIDGTLLDCKFYEILRSDYENKKAAKLMKDLKKEIDGEG